MIVFAFILFTRVLGGGGSEAAPVPAASTAVPVAGSSTPAEAPPAPGSGVEAPATTESAAGDPLADAAASGEFVAGPGLPQEVVSAYADGKAVVLLITRADGIDDRRIA